MKYLLSLLIIAVVLLSGACSKGGDAQETILAATAQVNAADGSPVRVASLSPESPIILTKGEWVMLGTTKYESALSGDPGEIRLENGKLKAKNLKVTERGR